MPAGQGEEERFAGAVEYGTTPATVRGTDDSAGGLVRELEIVAMLRSGAPALAPDPATRARAKQRLMAAFAHEFVSRDVAGAGDPTAPLHVVSPVAVAERPAAPVRPDEPTPVRRADRDVPPRTRRTGRHSAPEPAESTELTGPAPAEPELGGNVRRLRRRAEPAGGHRRAALLGAAAAAALVALAGGGTFASQEALPGDPMYRVKRVAESTSFALTFGEEAKARRHLERAQRRLDEVEGMVARNRTASAAATSDPELVQTTMQEFDTDANEGSRLLLAGPEPAEVEDVRAWAAEQSARLSALRSAMPAPDRADESLALLDRLLGEAEALQNGATCDPADAAAGLCSPASDPALGPDAGVTGADPDSGSTVSEVPGSSTDLAPGEADIDGEVTGDPVPGSGAPVSSTVRGEGSTSSERQDDGSDGGGPDESVSVPLPLPVPVDVPPAAGLPGVSLGR
jgi:hypothetical protein